VDIRMHGATITIMFVLLLSYFKHSQYTFSSQFSITLSSVLQQKFSTCFGKSKACLFTVSVTKVRKGHLCLSKSRKSVIYALAEQRETCSTDGNSYCPHQDPDKGLLFLSFACSSFRP